MIIVTGASGNLGRGVVDQLLKRLPAEHVGVSVRDPEKVADLADRGVRVRRGDFAEPATLADAFAGASRVLVVSVNALGDAGVARSTAAIDAAYSAGAERVLYTSHQAAGAKALFAPARDHAAVELYLEQQGRPYTSLRNGYYTSSLQFHLGDAATTGELKLPADGPVSWTARADLAEAAATVILSENPPDGPMPPLTATKAVDMNHVAEILSEVSGRPVERIVVDDDEFVASKVAAGMPEHVAQLFLATYLAARNNEFAAVDPTLRSLLAREPQSVRSVLAGGLTR